jgi:hypothetical protein
MATPEENREEEDQAIDRERAAFERHQKALTAVTRQFYPIGNGVPTRESLDEADAAEEEWEAARAVVERISAEIRSGKRR